MESEFEEVQKGNLGEWSELYTLAYLIVNGGAYGADPQLKPIPDLFYKTLAIYVAERGPDEEIEYRLDDQSLLINRGIAEPKSLPIVEVEKLFDRFKLDLISGGLTKTFVSKNGQDLLSMLGKSRLSADSAQTTSDLELVIQDHETGLRSPRIGFSVKSQIGSPATLLNAGKTTNFLFKLSKGPESPDLDSLDLTSWPKSNETKVSVKSDVQKLIQAGYSLIYQEMESANFEKNLRLIDSQMPENIADALVAAYSSKSSKLSEISSAAYPDSDLMASQKIYKMKQFLGAIAMGLRPSLVWDGDVTKFKGLLMVTAVGDVFFYYLYNLTSFQQFLFDSVKFEIASTSRHAFGRVFESRGEFYIKLNLQIRFTY